MLKPKLEKVRQRMEFLKQVSSEMLAEERDLREMRRDIAQSLSSLNQEVSDAIALMRTYLAAGEISEQWFPALIFEGTWVSRPRLRELIEEHQIETRYFQGKLCIRPKDFFQMVDAGLTTVPTSGAQPGVGVPRKGRRKAS